MGLGLGLGLVRVRVSVRVRVRVGVRFRVRVRGSLPDAPERLHRVTKGEGEVSTLGVEEVGVPGQGQGQG